MRVLEKFRVAVVTVDAHWRTKCGITLMIK